MAPLIGLALLLIAGLIVLFMRTISDLLLTLAGLFISIMWIVGIEGWLGPRRTGPRRPAEHPHGDGADRRDRPDGGLRDPGGLALPGAAGRRRGGCERRARGSAERHRSTAAGGGDDDRKPDGGPVLPGRDRRRLRRHRRAGRGDEPDRDADADPGGANDHRPAARGARQAAAGPPHLNRAARHRPDGRVPGEAGHPEARALHRRCAGGDARARVRGPGASIRSSASGTCCPPTGQCWRT